MHLTKEEEKILDGEEGEVSERLFRLLVRLGDIYGAEKMIPVGSVQVAVCWRSWPSISRRYGIKRSKS
jgi:predicted aconitase